MDASLQAELSDNVQEVCLLAGQIVPILVWVLLQGLLCNQVNMVIAGSHPVLIGTLSKVELVLVGFDLQHLV